MFVNPAPQFFPHPGATPAPFHFAGGAHLPPPPPPPPPPGVVPVHTVWLGNLAAAKRSLRDVAARARSVAFAVHYPGVVHVHGHGGAADHNALTPEQRYAAIKANVDALKPLQVGLAVGTHDGRCVLFEFNLSGFDAAADPNAPGSVAYLEERGMDLDAHRVHGIPMARLTEALHDSGLLRRGELSWISYAGAYHLVYVLKVIRGGLPLPGDMGGFLRTVRRFIGGNVYDVACMAGDCPILPVGLERIADGLSLARPVGSPRLAGAGGVLALEAFVFLLVCVFHGDVHRYRGLLHGLQVT